MAGKTDTDKEISLAALNQLKKNHPEMVNKKGELFPDDKANSIMILLDERIKSGEENPTFTLEVPPDYDPKDASKTQPDSKTYVFSVDPDTGNLRVEDAETGRDLADDPQTLREFLDEKTPSLWIMQQEQKYMDFETQSQEGQALEDPEEELDIMDEFGPYRQKGARIGSMIRDVQKTGKEKNFQYYRDGIVHTVRITPEFGDKEKAKKDPDRPDIGKSGVKITDEWVDKNGARHMKVIDTKEADRMLSASHRAHVSRAIFKSLPKTIGKGIARGARAGVRDYARHLAREITSPEAGFSRM